MKATARGARIVVAVLACADATPAGLAAIVGVPLPELVPHVNDLVAQGALSCRVADGRWILTPGKAKAVEQLAPADDTGVLAGWVAASRARRGRGSIPIQSSTEIALVSRRFSERCTGATFLVSCLIEQAASLRRPLTAAISAVRARGLAVQLVAGRRCWQNPEGRRVLVDLSRSGVDARVAHQVPTLLLWHGAGALHVTAENSWLQVQGADSLLPLATMHHRHAARVSGGLDGELLHLLAGGATDAMAARHLGISERQVRRHVASLMEELGADSRFQAGVLASRANRL